jgi:two-component system sensor histidine kinase QseC
MKLVNRITLWFIGIIFLITPFTMYISYNNIQKKIDNAEIERMTDVNERVAGQLKAGDKTDRYTQGRPIEISTFKGALPAKKLEVIESSVYNEGLNRKESILTVNSFFQIGDTNYKISSYNYVTKSAQIFSGMMNALIWKMLLIIVCVGITARFLSRQVFSPFRQTMKAIHTFNIKQKDHLRLPETSTKEFRELNQFLVKMTDRAQEDYAAVKEFSENASHELQTPLAVMRSKLELLTETDISEAQALLIADMQNAIEKLSRINRSLILLTKLENHEFEASENVKFCKITREVLATYSDRIALKNLSLNTRLDKNVTVTIHPTLAEILVTNLLGNAIRHNIEGGFIQIELTRSGLQISNSGPRPEIPIDDLFGRFKKSNQCADSTGLGLAIVKQICEVSDFCVDYVYEKGVHTLNVYFARDKKELLSYSVRRSADPGLVTA